MARINIDLRDDPEIPVGRDLFEQLVGAHMVARDEEELLHFVNHSLDALFSSPPEHGLRVMTHAAYRGQSMVVRLLDLAARQRMLLAAAGVDDDRTLPARNPDSFKVERLDLWNRLRDLQNW